MDLRSPELLQIFCEELEERASRLAKAARSLREERPDRGTVSDLVRDAHTIKGSAGLLGFAQVAGAARSVEDAWRQVAEGSLLTPAAVEALEDIAGRFLAISAIRQLEDDPQLTSAHRRLEHAISEPVEFDEDAEFRRPRDAGSLGGLLSSVAESLLGGATRVDTAELYRLINRIVEASLDADSLADLSMVSIAGSDPGRLIQAWRGQLERLSSGIAEIQAQAVALANVSFREATATFPQFIRYLGRRLEKDVRFDVAGTDVELDRQIVDLLREPLRHLLVNAVDHGIEPPTERLAVGKASTGAVTLRAQRVEDRLEISVGDDGAGVDWAAVEATAASMGLGDVAELSSVLFEPGFSIRTETTDFSGGGDGLAIVRDVVEGLHGGVTIESTPGQGTSVILTLPVSRILQNIVLVSTDNQFWGLPEASLEAAMPLTSAELHVTESGRRLRFQSRAIPVISLAQAIGAEDTAEERELLVVSTRLGLVGVTVGELVDRRRVAVKNLGPILEGAGHITGAALLGGGEVLVVLDPTYLGAYARRLPSDAERRPGVLVVDDSAGVRQLLSATLNGAGFEVTVAGGARDAVLAMAEKDFDALVIDFSMPRSNGADLVRALRAAGVKVPIIMVSGVANASEQQAAWDAGVDAYLDKFDLRQGVLTSTLRRLIGMRTESAS